MEAVVNDAMTRDGGRTVMPFDGDFGVVDPNIFRRNMIKAERENKNSCIHCGRGVDPQTCYVVKKKSAQVVRTSLWNDPEFQEWDVAVVGSTCIKKTVPAEYAVKFSSLPEDHYKWDLYYCRNTKELEVK